MKSREQMRVEKGTLEKLILLRREYGVSSLSKVVDILLKCAAERKKI